MAQTLLLFMQRAATCCQHAAGLAVDMQRSAYTRLYGKFCLQQVTLHVMLTVVTFVLYLCRWLGLQCCSPVFIAEWVLERFDQPGCLQALAQACTEDGIPDETKRHVGQTLAHLSQQYAARMQLLLHLCYPINKLPLQLLVHNTLRAGQYVLQVVTG